MALWQFTTMAALIGVLLVYVMVLTNRIGATNALLKRIEEALVKPRPVTENTGATRVRAPLAARRPAAVVPAMEPEARQMEPEARQMESPAREMESGAPELSDALDVPGRDRRVSFLTVRDLKVIARSGRRSGDSTAGMSPLFREAMERKRAEALSLAEQGQTGEERTRELDSLPQELPVSVQELTTTAYEIRDFPESANAPATEDVVPSGAEVLAPATNNDATDEAAFAAFASTMCQSPMRRPQSLRPTGNYPPRPKLQPRLPTTWPPPNPSTTLTNPSTKISANVGESATPSSS